MNNIVIAISGKTCSGKTYLLNQLLNTEKFSKLVTSTTRCPREGEKEGEDYHFIQSSLAEHYIDSNQFIEYNVYGNQIYGLTKYELESKLDSEKIPCVILTPNGVEVYKKLLAEMFGITVIAVFIDCPVEVLVDRLAKRTLDEKNLDLLALKVAFERAISVSLNEQGWKNYLNWDLILTAGGKHLDQRLINFIKLFQTS